MSLSNNKIKTDNLYVAYKMCDKYEEEYEEGERYTHVGDYKMVGPEGPFFVLKKRHYKIIILNMHFIFLDGKSLGGLTEPLTVRTDKDYIPTSDCSTKLVDSYYKNRYKLRKEEMKADSYVFPVKLSVIVEELLGKELPKEMSMRDLKKLRARLNKLHGNNLNKELCLYNWKDDSIDQLSEIVGISKNIYEWKRGEKKPLSIAHNKLVKEISADEEVKKIIDKLNLLTKEHSNASEKILNEIKRIVEEYKKALEESKPKFEKTNPNSEIALKFEPVSPKEKLLLDLNKLYYACASQIRLYDYVAELKKCKSYTEGKQKGENITPLQKDILDILEHINTFSSKEKEKMLEKLQKSIDKELNKTNNELQQELKNFSNSEIELEHEIFFKKEIKELKKECEEKANLYKPFIRFQKALQSNSSQIFPNDKELTVLTKTISFVLDNIENEHLKEEEQKKYNLLRSKYLQIVNKILEDEEKLTKTNFEQFELKFLKELRPLIDELGNISTKSLNQVISKGSLRAQIQNSLDILNGRGKEKEKYSKEPIASYTLDIMDLFTKESIHEQELLTTTLQEQLNLLEKKEINNYADYDKARAEILRQLASFHLDLLTLRRRNKDYKNQELKEK